MKVYDMTKDGWTLPDGDIEYKSGKVELELVEFLKPGENRVKGTVMAKRAVKLGANLGQKHAEAFLAKYDYWIPPEEVFRIPFPGTVWRDSDRRRRVPFIGWDVGRQFLGFGFLEDDWYSSPACRLLRPRSNVTT